jgi:hypothetical protein
MKMLMREMAFLVTKSWGFLNVWTPKRVLKKQTQHVLPSIRMVLNRCPARPALQSEGLGKNEKENSIF